jgi:hypothetical protein
VQAAIYQDIPRIYTALAEWLACVVYCLVLKRKVKGIKFYALAIGYLALLAAFLQWTADVRIQWWFPCMLIAVFSMYGFLYLMCHASKRMLAYYCARAFLLAEFAASLEWQVDCFLRISWDLPWLKILVLIVFYTLTYVAAYQMERYVSKDVATLELKGREVLASICIAAAVFSFSNFSFVVRNTPFSGRLTADVFYIRTLVDLAGLMILYVYQSRLCEMETSRELTQIQSVLKNQYDKYRYYQESFDMINMKYHDLKHQIAGLRAEMTKEQREEWIDSLEQELDDYRPEMQTGSNVLDVLIQAKTVTCKNNRIKLTCVAEGSLLEFMHVADVCTIFGNALDNAIENVALIPDEEKRLIHLSVSSRKNFVMIQVRNYSEQKVKLRNGLPVTTKRDKQNHGYGLKSIRYTIEKYHGNMDIEFDKNWFELNILIPKPETAV